MRRQLYGDEDDRTFFDWIQRELRAVEKTLEDGRAVLQHLEMFLVNVACNDPGAAIGASLVLPLLQERLEAKALEFAAQRAAEAEEAIIKMEVCALNAAASWGVLRDMSIGVPESLRVFLGGVSTSVSLLEQSAAGAAKA